MPGISHSIENPGLDPVSWKAACDEMYEHLQSVTPVRTGDLQNGWQMKINSGNVIFNDPVDYASYVNSGTPKMAPRDMTGQLDAVASDIIESHRTPDEDIDQAEYREARMGQIPPYRR